MFNWLLIFLGYLPFQIALNIGVDLASSRLFIVLFFLICIKKLKKIFTFQSIWLFVFLAFSFLSLLQAENISWGLRKLIYFLSIFPLYLLVINLVKKNQVEKVFKILVWGGGIVALIGLLQFLAQFVFGLEAVYYFWAGNITYIFSGFNYGSLILAYPSWLVNVNGATIMRAFSIFSDPHILAFYAGMLIPLADVLWVQQEPYRKSIFNSHVVMILFVALLLSFSRGAYLAIIVAFLVVVFLMWKYLGSKKALLNVFLLLIFVIPGTPVSSRFYSSFDANEGSNIGRLEMWQQAGQAGLRNPFLGLGLGNLSADSQHDYRNPVTAHNLYLDIFSEIGLFALIAWLVLILGTIWRLFKKKDRLAIGLIGSLVYFSIHSIFETAVYSPVILAVLMVILGLSTICEN